MRQTHFRAGFLGNRRCFHFWLNLLILCFGAACTGHDPEADRMRSFGGKADVVFFYKADLTDGQMEEANRTLIEKQRPDNRGHDLPDGVSGIFMVRNGKYEGFSVNFWPNATKEQKCNVIKALRESAAVFRVFENVDPNEIGPLPQASPESTPPVNPKTASKH